MIPRGRNEGEVRTYNYSEISRHSSPDDLWMILHGKVYDITSVMDSHPGGPEVLLEAAGSDSSIAFDEVGHSQDSLEMLKPLLVGIVDEYDELTYYKSNTKLKDTCKKVANSSIGESKFSRKLKRRRSRQSRDEILLYVLTFLAIIAALGYIWLASRKWS